MPQSIYVSPDRKHVVNLLTGDMLEFSASSSMEENSAWLQSATSTLTSNQSPRSLNPSHLTYTIEVTRRCNLDCIYCYQNDRKTTESIDDRTIARIAHFISQASQVREVEAVDIRVMGGEPTLNRQAILRLKNAISSAVDIEVNWHFDTNGYLPIQWILDRFANVDISVCLSMPKDHDHFRRGRGFDSALRIYGNLSTLQRRSEDQEVNLHYNTHRGNMEELEEFLKWIAPL